MPLVPGTHLGLYEIVSPLGAGGMGEVYRARDTKLGRDVAIKVLPDSFAKDAERMARFQREAKLLASLNHPNIAAIYGIEDSGSAEALVMELAEGPTLAERIAQGPIPVEEALRLAWQICEALEYAHERGVVHRDLKPANIKVSYDESLKVLDFGLAKAVQGESSEADIGTSPTLTHMATQAGVLLGTAAYMSPEQAKGKSIDRRADIWAFGCVLYEMLSGSKPFDGETNADILAAVVKSEPDWKELPPATPRRVRELIRRCLTKEAKQRLRDIGDARITIAETISNTGNTDESSELANIEAPRRRRAALWVAASALLICLAVIAGWWIGNRKTAQTTRWLGDLLAVSNMAYSPRVSPDGRTLAFLAMVNNITQVAVANPNSGNWTVLTHDQSHGRVHELAWSPDGSKIFFDRNISNPEGIYSVPSLGGDERLVLKDAAGPEPLPDGSLLIWRIDEQKNQRLYHFWPESGRIEPLGAWILPLFPVAMHRVFPDGKGAVFYGWGDGAALGGPPHLYAIDLESGKSRRLAPQLSIRQTGEGFPMAPTADNRSVLIDLLSGDLHQIVAIPRFGSGSPRVLMTLTQAPWTMDAGPDGSIYLDQWNRPLQILRFSTSGGAPEVLGSSPVYSAGISSPVQFSDGRLLFPSRVSGVPRLLVGQPGGAFFPLSDTPEETHLPATLLPGNQVAFVAGTASEQTIAIASAADGRILRWLQGCKGNYVTSLVASDDGQILYYAAGGFIWAIPAADGQPRKVAAGVGVVVDPNGKDLIVNSLEKSGESLFRIPLSGGPAQQIAIRGDVSLSYLPLGGNSLSKSGKLLVAVTAKGSWFFSVAVLDLNTGRAREIPLDFPGDHLQARWTDDGRILGFAYLTQAHIWRFRPIANDSN